MAGIKRSPMDVKKRGSTGTERKPSSARTRRTKRGNDSGLFTFKKRSTRTRSTAKTGQPPVMTRRSRGDMATPIRKKSGSGVSPRRRFDLTLDVPGAEIRLPSLPVFHISWRFASGGTVVLMLFLLYALLFSPLFQVEMIQVDGLERFTLSELNQEVALTGEAVVSLDAAVIRERLLEAFPGLKDVRVSIGLPAAVQVTVEERRPVIVWIRGEESSWVDADGVVFAVRGEWTEPLLKVKAGSLPMISEPTGKFTPEGEEVFAERLDPDVVKNLQVVSAYMPEGEKLVYDEQHGVGWSDNRGWQVYLGSRLSDIDQKLLVYQAIVDHLQADGIQPAVISVEYLHAPFYRLEQ